MNYEAIATWSEVASSVLFVVALVLVWNKYIAPAVLRAQDAQNARIAEAERHRDEASRAVRTLQAEIEDAKRDAEAIKQRGHSQASAERDAVLREAREAGERAVQDAQAEMPRAMAAARERLRDELLERALDEARLQAQQKLDAAADRKVVDAFVQSLQGGRA